MTNYQSSQGVLRLVIGGEVQTETGFPLPANAEVTLGREPTCDIVLDVESGASRRHAIIRSTQPGEWTIQDLNSSNGTYINGRRLQGEGLLRPGDRIQLANPGPEFLFEIEQEAKPAPQAAATFEAPPVVRHRTIEEPLYRLDLSPTRLVLYRKSGWISGCLPAACGLTIFIVFVPPLVLFIPVIWLLLAYAISWDTAYTIDLLTNQFILSRESLLRQWLKRPEHRYYPLSEFTAVRLRKSDYRGDEGARYDNYEIYLERQRGKAIKLEIAWRYDHRNARTHDNPDKAQAVVDWLEQYLVRSA